MRDEVDELSEAWASQRPDLDLGAVAVFSRISRLAKRLDLARREAFTAHGIESWEFDVLAALRIASTLAERIRGVWHDVEWMDSCDYALDDVVEGLAKWSER